MRRNRTWLGVATLCWLSLCGQVQAQVVVLSAEGAAPRPAFVASLRIHLPPDTSVADGGTLRIGSPSERIEQALGAAELNDALAAVWVEGPVARRDGTGELVLYVVGRKENRAIVDVLRVSTGDSTQLDHSVDRSLALKVSQVLSDLMHGTDVIEATPPAAPTRDSASWRGGAYVGGLMRTGSGTVDAQPGLRVAVGARAPLPIGSIDVIGRIHLLPRARAQSEVGTITLSEVSPAIEAAWTVAIDRWSIGASVGAQLRVIEVAGQTAAGTRGDQNASILSLNVGPVLRLALHSNVQLAFGTDVEVSLHRRRYTINDSVRGDTGRLRATLHAGLFLTVP